jgi:predicted 3-demethylubiquinone-9 3-methyltransferase (glyoxalase superfamily)
VNSVSRGPDGNAFMVTFELDGQNFMALNGGSHYKLNAAFSIFVSVETQEQVDALWEKLTADGGEESMCGWLKDKFGLSWQIISTALMELMSDPNPNKANAVTQAMLKMQKIDLATLRQAHAQS